MSIRATPVALDDGRKANFRSHHISTDEIFGTLKTLPEGSLNPSPISQVLRTRPSKAGSNHLVRAWVHAHGLPTQGDVGKT